MIGDATMPWLWIGVGVALAALEMLVPSFLLVWPGVAALAVGLLLFAVPDLGLAGQGVLFAVLAVAFTLGGRAYVLRHKARPADHPALNRRGARLVGRRGVALEAFSGGRGSIEIDGELWQARAVGAVPSGAAVEVVGVEGAELVVEAR
jgi:membrane protein implicated in regulation of membrane protease activity